MKKIELKVRKKVLSAKEMRNVRGAVFAGYNCPNPNDYAYCSGHYCGSGGWGNCRYVGGGSCTCDE